MRRDLAVIVLAAGLAFAGPVEVQAGDAPRFAEHQRERAEELAREGMRALLGALEAILATIPQYEMPEVMDNGDIIIRRSNPRPPANRDAPRRKGPSET